jgi:hypothetical protein
MLQNVSKCFKMFLTVLKRKCSKKKPTITIIDLKSITLTKNNVSSLMPYW